MFKWEVTIKILNSTNGLVQTLKREVWADTIDSAKQQGHDVAGTALDKLGRDDLWYLIEAV